MRAASIRPASARTACASSLPHWTPRPGCGRPMAWVNLSCCANMRHRLVGQLQPGRPPIVTASADATARVWKADGPGAPVVLRGHQGSVLSASFSPDGPRIVTASADTTARVWKADGLGEPVVLRGHEGSVSSASFSPDGMRIVTASADETARVWKADGLGEPVVLRGHEGAVTRPASARTARGSSPPRWTTRRGCGRPMGTGHPSC